MKRYEIMAATRLPDLEKQVNEAMTSGAEPIGGPSAIVHVYSTESGLVTSENHMFLQAVILNESDAPAVATKE